MSHSVRAGARRSTHGWTLRVAARYACCSWLQVMMIGSFACGTPANSSSERGAAPSNALNAASTDNPLAPSADCGQMNATQPCRCASAPGRQVCNGDVWGACECASSAPTGANASVDLAGNARTDIKFAWAQTPPSGDQVGGCLPGDYEGNFGGLYWSYIATLAPIDGLAVPIANIDLPDAPSGFHFTVMPAEGGETVLKINGQMDGTADLTFPFSADIEGQLDCKTKQFSAQMLNGTYSVLIQGLVAQQFIGVMHGTYDVHTQTFVNGDWDVWETSGMPPGKPAPMLPRDFDRDGFGGYGTWAAALPTDLTNAKIVACSSDYACDSGPLGPNKFLCSSLLGPPGCSTDADCDAQFPGAGVSCLMATAFSTCLMECRP